jgi:NADP-dependent 3-hydroxy acid dehydrogenase YdfG
LTDTANAIKAKYPSVQVEAIQLNVCDENAVNAAIEQTVQKFGRIDVAVNVAGIGGANLKTTDAEEPQWAKVLDVNLNGVWRSQRAELRAMLKQEWVFPFPL